MDSENPHFLQFFLLLCIKHLTNYSRLDNQKEQVLLYPTERSDFMLQPLKNHSCYLNQLDIALAKIPIDILEEFDFEISFFRLLNFDPALSLFSEKFSHTGRPSTRNLEIFRAFLYASQNKMNVKELRKTLRSTPIIRALCGFPSKADIPCCGTFYNFMNRLVPIQEAKQVKKPLGQKPSKKELGDDQKLKDKRPASRTTKLAQKIIDKKISLDSTPERFLQKVMALIAVKPSIQLGLLTKQLSVSADGTCLKTGASSRGKWVCDCRKKGIWKCNCDRLYSDPLANIGWDSHEKKWFYGYTAFFLSSFSEKYKKDLPFLVRLVDAKRHDSLSSMLALVDFQEVYPELTMQHFLADSAMDAGPIYSLLNEKNISAIIDLNTRNLPKEKQGDITFDKKGCPICPAGRKMTFNGSWERNMSRRIKYRCSAKAKKSEPCHLETPCSTSNYGRTFYVKADDDLRLYPTIPRDSKEWKELYKQRTATERVNKQVLIDYGLENMKVRTKHRNFFFTIMASINIHLKAQLSIVD